MRVRTSWRQRLIGVCATAVVLPLVLGPSPAGATPPPAGGVAPLASAAVAKTGVVTDTGGAFVVGFPNVNGNQLNVDVYSPAMGRNVPIQVLVPPGYNYFSPFSTYPEFYMLDGLRAPTSTTDWTNMADTKSFFADKSVLVVQTIGGAGSFFQDWAHTDPGLLANNREGGALNWETFLTKELPGVIGTAFHGNGQRAIAGLSMGGFSAFSLAAKHAELYKAAASYSGYLNSQAAGLPEFLQYVLSSQSMASDPANLWGTPDKAPWTENNPTAQIAKLKGMSLYLSAGTGGNGPYDKALGFLGLSSEYIGALLEVVANYSTQSFNQTAIASGVNTANTYTTDLANPGIHSWGYWNVQYRKSWPQMAAAIGANTSCTVGGVIDVEWQLMGAGKAKIGACTGNEVQAAGQPGGVVQQSFTNGHFYFSPATGARGVQGAIDGKYQALGGSASFLGLPLTNELTTPNGLGFYTRFQNGYIYYTGTGGIAYEVHGAILAEWGRQGYETSRFGFPVSDEYQFGPYRRSDFQGGSILYTNGQISFG